MFHSQLSAVELKSRNRRPIFLYHCNFLGIRVGFPVGHIKMYCMLLCTFAVLCFCRIVTGTFARMWFHNATPNTPSLIMSVSQTESTFHYHSNNALETPLDESCSRTMSYGWLAFSYNIVNAGGFLT